MDISRSPRDYRPDPSGHFRQRYKEREIPDVVIQKAIEGGTILPDEAEGNRVALRTEYLGREWELVVNPTKKYVITGYCLCDDWP